MPDPVTGTVVGATLLSGHLQSQQADITSRRATKASVGAAESGIEETRRQFDAIQELLSPYVETGAEAQQAQRAIAGLGTPEEQRLAIQQIQESPQFQAITQQGEEAILAGASATGGLRGGNVQQALSQFRPEVLSSLIQQRFQNLGGIAGRGQASAAGQAAFGQQAGADIANLFGQRGAAQAGGALAQGQARSDLFGMIPGLTSLGTQAFNRPSPTAVPAAPAAPVATPTQIFV